MFITALALRWLFSGYLGGERFIPGPDAIEYAAGAHSLAYYGRYHLQIGHGTFQPRYPPGWSALLVLPVKLGVAGERLWYFSGIFGAMHAVLFMVVGYCWTLWLLRSWTAKAPTVCRLWALFAGLVAGFGWAVTPVSLYVGSSIMSDEPGAFFANAALVLLIWAAVRAPFDRISAILCASGGIAMGTACVMRSANAPFLCAGLGVIGLMLLAQHGLLTACRWAAAGAAGCLVPAAAASLLMYHSGYQPLAWSAYGFWVPEIYEHQEKLFNLSFAHTGNPLFVWRDKTGTMLSHLTIAKRLLLGLPGVPLANLGLYWPAAAWAFGIGLVIFAVLRRAQRWTVVLGVGTAVAAWAAAHAAFFSLYFFPEVRFYTPVLPWAWVCAGLVLALLGAFSLFTRLIALLFGGVIVWSSYTSLAPHLAWRGISPLDHNSRAAFAHWLQLSDEQRKGAWFPGDPVVVQAIGLITPEVTDRVAQWGMIAETEHVQRLRRRGIAVRSSRN